MFRTGIRRIRYEYCLVLALFASRSAVCCRQRNDTLRLSSFVGCFLNYLSLSQRSHVLCRHHIHLGGEQSFDK